MRVEAIEPHHRLSAVFFVVVPSPSGCGDEIGFADLELLAFDDETRAMTLQNETNRACHMAV